MFTIFQAKPVPTQPEGAAFDLEVTMVADQEPFHHASHVIVAADESLHLNLNDTEELLELVPSFFGGPDIAVMREIYDKGNKIHHDREARVQLMLERDQYLYREMLRNCDVLNPREGVVKVLMKLRESGFPIAIGSVTPRQDAMQLLEKSGLYAYFDPGRIVVAEDVTHHKPHGEVYMRTAQLMGIEPGQQVVLGDSWKDMAAARHAGSHPIGMPVNMHPAMIEKLYSNGAHHVAAGWHEINLIGQEGPLETQREFRPGPEYDGGLGYQARR